MKVKGFSLVETIITLAIFGIMIAMISQVILINLEVSRKVFVRTQIREQLAELTTLVQRDIRNAKIVKDCGEFQDGPDLVNRCTILHAQEFTWTDNCPGDTDEINRVCKISVPGNELLFETSDLITIDDFSFDINLSSGDDGTKSTILMTLLASATNPNFEISNQVRQIAVSTRNFTLGDFYVGATPTVSQTTVPTQVVCPYSSTQVTLTDQTTGVEFINGGNIPCGRSVRVNTYHNNNEQANDVNVSMTVPGSLNPQSVSAGQVIELTTPGQYNFSGSVTNYAGSACSDTASISCFVDPTSQCPSQYNATAYINLPGNQNWLRDDQSVQDCSSGQIFVAGSLTNQGASTTNPQASSQVQLYIDGPNGQQIAFGQGNVQIPYQGPGTYSIDAFISNTNEAGQCADQIKLVCGGGGSQTSGLPSTFTIPDQDSPQCTFDQNGICADASNSGSLVIHNMTNQTEYLSCADTCAAAGGVCYAPGWQIMHDYATNNPNCGIWDRFISAGTNLSCIGYSPLSPRATMSTSLFRAYDVGGLDPYGTACIGNSSPGRQYRICPCIAN